MSTTIRNREEAVEAALATSRNVPRRCQEVTRGWFLAPAVGDFDGDGAADAEDGWKSEPEDAKHPGDRKPPRGTPVSYGSGSEDNGHRAISLGPVGSGGRYMIRSTDGGGSGITATVPLEFPETEWGMPYLGWSETISRFPIPLPVADVDTREVSRKRIEARIEAAIKDVLAALDAAKDPRRPRVESKLRRSLKLLRRARTINRNPS